MSLRVAARRGADSRFGAPFTANVGPPKALLDGIRGSDLKDSPRRAGSGVRSPAHVSLQLIEVTRRYGAQFALERLSLDVRDGDLYGFLGHNGAGKTTAMRIVLGLVRASSGRVLIDGFDAARHPREARARLGGLIEVPGFHGHLDARQNLDLLARVQGLDRKRSAVETARLLELVGLAKTGSKAVSAFSHGMRQRLGIAQALLGSPRYVLLDEPMNGLDPEGIAEVRDILRSASREHGVTVLFSTHQLHEVEGLCNRVAVINRGRLVIEAATADLFAADRARYRIRCDDERRAAELMTGRGLVSREIDGELEVDLGATDPAEVLRELVRANLAVRQFAPRPASLEEIYLRHTRAARAGNSPAPSRSSAETVATHAPNDRLAPNVRLAPAERLAPNFPKLRALRYELARLAANRGTALVVALPAVVGALAVWSKWRDAQADLAKVQNEQVFSATASTAFEGTALALSSALPLVMLVVAGLASQSIAHELGRNTLRNLLERPVLRTDVALGKIAAQMLTAVVALALLIGVALFAASRAFEFRDVTEVLPNGEHFVLIQAKDLWPALERALVSPILPIFGYLSIGFLCGTLVRSAAGALALCMGSVLALDLARAFARPWGIEAWLPSAYLPSPLGDTSYVKYFADFAQGVSNASFEYASSAELVPLAWIVTSFGLAAWILNRRQVS